MKEAIGIGDTVEKAKEDAYQKLGVESDEVEYEVLELPIKKTLGLFGGNPAKVRAYIEDNSTEIAKNYLSSILDAMGLDEVKIETEPQENGAMLTITGEDVGFIIGHRGETLDALQYLSGLVVNHKRDDYFRITLDIGNYREKRRETLEALGKKMAGKSLKYGRNFPLEPMNPYERRIIHTAVSEVEGAKSWSEGQDLARHVVIGPEAGERPVNYRNNNRRPYNNNHSGGFQGQNRPYQNNRYPAKTNRPAPVYGRVDRSSEEKPAFNSPKPEQRAASAEAKTPFLYGRIDVKKEKEE